MPDVSGTFRSGEEANRAVSELKQAGFTINQIGIQEAAPDLTVAQGRVAEPATLHSQRATLTVHADDREQDAVGILKRCGAYDLGTGQAAGRPVSRPVDPADRETPFGKTRDVANGMT